MTSPAPATQSSSAIFGAQNGEKTGGANDDREQECDAEHAELRRVEPREQCRCRWRRRLVDGGRVRPRQRCRAHGAVTREGCASSDRAGQ